MQGGAPGTLNIQALDPASLRHEVDAVVLSGGSMYGPKAAPGAEVRDIGRRRLARTDGLPLEESEALLDEFRSHATRPEICWTNRWRVGDLVLWDNRCTLHRTQVIPGSRSSNLRPAAPAEWPPPQVARSGAARGGAGD